MTFSLVGIAPGSDATLSFSAHYSMLRTIKHFACGQLSLDGYSGTGNGLIKRLSVMGDSVPEEVWTLTATSDTNFTVSGSISGAQAAATVDTFYDNGLVSFIILSGGTAFVASDAFVLSSTSGVRTLYQSNYVGAGNGKLTKMLLLDKLSEIWTLTCTVASPGAGTFSVSGSVSGAQANATVGVDYDNGVVQLLINDGTADFEVGDAFTLTAKTKELPLADRWKVLLFDDTTDDYEMILVGNGIPGFGPVWIGMTTRQSVASDYYNIAVATMQSYVSSNTYLFQPNIKHRTLPTWQFDVSYKLRISARSIAFSTNTEGLYDVAANGFYLPNYDPGIYPYPSFVCASLAGISTTRFSDTSRNFGVDGGVELIWLDSTYRTPKTLPYESAFYNLSSEFPAMAPTETAEVTQYSGVGDGTIIKPFKYNGSPTENWTITATSATNFTVVGSVSGAQPDATVDVFYDNSIIRFLIEDGATPFVSGDVFTLSFSVQYALEKIVLNDSDTNYGELEGLYFITGFQNAVENTVIDDIGNTHHVIRSINKAGFLDYATIVED
tara:strand:+ start:6825 stop:8483 length:1659 start_codon:yes stop_codon:yes gene_type:complete